MKVYQFKFSTNVVWDKFTISFEKIKFSINLDIFTTISMSKKLSTKYVRVMQILNKNNQKTD